MAKKSAASKSKSAQATTTSILPDAPLPAPSTSALVERSEEATPPPPVVLPPKEKVPKINTSSLAELKNTCDDVVKEFFARPSAFNRSHVHEDVRLSLGWLSVVIALGTAYYGYVVPFEESKTWVTIGVGLYALLNSILTLYTTYYEKQIIFEGKRRTFASRISTERLTISSLASSSPNTTSLTPAFPLSLISRGPALPTPPPFGTSYPAYTLVLDYSHSSNNGKSIIHQALVTKTQCFGEFFDVEGKLAKSKLEAELQKLLAEVVGQ